MAQSGAVSGRGWAVFTTFGATDAAAMTQVDLQTPNLITDIPRTLDGTGAARHDKTVSIGWRPSVALALPFSTRECGRLQLLRGRTQDRCGAQIDGDACDWPRPA